MIRQVIFLIFVLTISLSGQTFEGLNLAPLPSSLPSENIGSTDNSTIREQASLNREQVNYDIQGTLDQRIVSLSPLISKIIQDIGAEYQLKGITELCPIIKKDEIAIIGSATINVSAIMQLEPDKVLGMENRKALERKFSLYDQKTRYFKQPKTTRDIHQLILEVGAAIDELSKAQDYVVEIKKELEAFQQTRKFFPPKKVLILYWPTPLMGIGSEHPLNDMLYLAGGINIINKLMPFAPITDQVLIQLDPDTIILTNPDDKRFIEDNPLLKFKVDGSKRQIISDIPSRLLILPDTDYVKGIKAIHFALYGGPF